MDRRATLAAAQRTFTARCSKRLILNEFVAATIVCMQEKSL
jgi:hypothetical protein